MTSLIQFTTTRRQVLVNTASQVGGRILTTGTTFLVSILLVQNFGILTYGDFIKITTFVTPFYLLADFGINAIYIQYLSNRSALNERNVWSNLLILRIILSLFLMFFILALIYILPKGISDGYTKSVRIGILLYAPSILFQAIITSANAVFQKHLQYIYVALSSLAGTVGTLGILFLVLNAHPASNNELYAMLIIGMGTIITAFTSLYFVRHAFRFFQFSFQTKTVVSLFIKSLPLGITLLFNLIYFRIDSYILTMTRSTAEVGVYGFIYKIFETALVFPTFFMNAVYPLLLSKKSTLLKKSYSVFLLKSFLVLLGSSLMVLGLLIYASQFLIHLHSEFYTGLYAFRILAYGLPLFYLSSLTMWVLISFKKHWLLVYIYGATMAVNIILNVKYIPLYGMNAASWITVLCEALVLIVSVLFVLKFLFSNKEPDVTKRQILPSSPI